MTKKITLLFALMLSTLMVSAHDIEVQNADGVTIYYNYINNGTELEVTYQGSSHSSYSHEYIDNVVIPEEVTYMNRTRKVTSIGSSAFWSCSGLTSVKIPNSVTSIGDNAFEDCSGLRSVTIPNSVTSIGDYAFLSCSGLRSVTIPNSVTSIGTFAFRGCSGLTSVTIPNSVTSIGDYAFYDCSGLTSVTIGSGVTSIGEKAFSYCSSLKSVKSDISVPFTFGSNAFSNISSNCVLAVPYGTKDAYITKGWTTSVFKGGIKEFFPVVYGIYYYFNSNNKQATVTASENNYSGNVIIPSSVTYNGETYSVTSIGGSAFQNCSGLTSVTIPNSVKSIGSSAFSGCSRLTSVHITDIAAWCKISFFNAYSNPLYYAKHLFMDGKEITDLVIPNSVTSIRGSAFSYCTGLTSVTIPNSVTSIGERAFYGCSKLTSVTIGSGVTSIGSSAFDRVDIPTVVSLIENPFAITGKTSDSRTFTQNTFLNAALYVPKGAIEKYKATDGWKDFVFMEEGEGPGGDTPEPPIPEPQKCATPTISYENGKLTFSCDTEGATCQYSITDTDIKAGSGNEVQLTTTYKVTVYATKAGYENSDEATLEINISGGASGLRGDVNEDCQVNGTDIQEVINIIVNAE